MLLRTDREGRNAWANAAFGGKVEALREIWKLAKKILTKEEIKNEKLLRTDREGKNACINAAFGGKVEAMREIWVLAKGN